MKSFLDKRIKCLNDLSNHKIKIRKSSHVTAAGQSESGRKLTEWEIKIKGNRKRIHHKTEQVFSLTLTNRDSSNPPCQQPVSYVCWIFVGVSPPPLCSLYVLTWRRSAAMLFCFVVSGGSAAAAERRWVTHSPSYTDSPGPDRPHTSPGPSQLTGLFVPSLSPVWR